MAGITEYIEACRIGDAAAEEILNAYDAIEEPKWRENDRPVTFRVAAPSLVDVPMSNALLCQVGYGEKVALRKGHGIIAVILQERGICTGEVDVQPACDDFDL